MRQAEIFKMTACGFFVACFVFAGVAQSAPADSDIVGLWKMKSDFDGRTMESLWWFSKDKQGVLQGRVAGFRGISEMKDVKYDQGKLAFTQTNRTQQGESTSTFNGVLKDGLLTGSASSQRGEYTLEGTKIPAAPAVAGSWEIKSQRGDRTMVSTLTVKINKDGKALVAWKSPRGESEISDISLKDGTLTFKRKITAADQPREITYALTAAGDTISGTVQTERGQRPIEGKRIGAALVGMWELSISSERGNRSQLLVVNPDLSGLYGPIPVENIVLQDNNVSFKATMSFGQRSIETEFKCTLDSQQLTLAGEVISTPPPNAPRTGDQAPGTAAPAARKVTGKKIVDQAAAPTSVAPAAPRTEPKQEPAAQTKTQAKPESKP